MPPPLHDADFHHRTRFDFSAGGVGCADRAGYEHRLADRRDPSRPHQAHKQNVRVLLRAKRETGNVVNRPDAYRGFFIDERAHSHLIRSSVLGDCVSNCS